MGEINRHRPIKMTSGQHASNLAEEIQWWENRIKDCVNIKTERLKQKVEHIQGEQWGNEFQEENTWGGINKDLAEIRKIQDSQN